MLLAALVIGVLTAYYYGPRLGVTAGAVAAGLLFLALFAPPIRLVVYTVTAAWVAGVCFLGPRRPTRYLPLDRARHVAAWVRRRLKR